MRLLLTLDNVGNVLPSIDLDVVLSEFTAVSGEDKTTTVNACNTHYSSHSTLTSRRKQEGESSAVTRRNQGNTNCNNAASSKENQARSYIDNKFNWFPGQIGNLKARPPPPPPPRPPPPPPPPPPPGKRRRRRGRCFARNTRCRMENGETRFIQDIVVGDSLRSGGRVEAVMILDSSDVVMYDIHGVVVSGDHAVMYEERFVRAERHPYATVTKPVDELFNIITEHHRIEVVGRQGPMLCADYEETDDTDADLDGYLKIMNATYER